VGLIGVNWDTMRVTYGMGEKGMGMKKALKDNNIAI
jgi:hypothetical protein